jgi:hypothetical protein
MWMKSHNVKQEDQLKDKFRPEPALNAWKLETVNPDLHGAGFWRGLKLGSYRSLRHQTVKFCAVFCRPLRFVKLCKDWPDLVFSRN